MLSERRARILSIIISEYLDTATPVGSEAIQRKHALGVSPATIRNDMASLEQEGYITHPHTSAGRIPAEKGYRYYIDALMPRTALPADEQLTIQHQFYQASQDLEQWVRLAATVLARSAGNAALVAPPRSTQPRFQHLELIPLRELMLLVLVVLQEARIKRQVIQTDDPLSPDTVALAAGRLNALLQGRSAAEIRAVLSSMQLPPHELLIVRTIHDLLQAEEQRLSDQPYLEGLRNLLGQPEFSSADRMLAILDLLEDPLTRQRLFDPLWESDNPEQGPQVKIGRENTADIGGLGNLSVVIASYGVPGEALGALAVVGPTRMAYPRVLATVHFLAGLMTKLLQRELR